jgi:hypothetical protein
MTVVLPRRGCELRNVSFRAWTNVRLRLVDVGNIRFLPQATSQDVS